MKELFMFFQRTTLVNLKDYDITLTHSSETKHGISGHLFEMAEYFYHFTFHKNIKTSILIPDGTTEDEFFTALINKYSFTDEELLIYKQNTFFHYQPKVIIGNTLIFVDGSLRTKNCDIIAKKKILIRCCDDEYLEQGDIVLQDYDLYEPLKNSIHYKKKLLFSKFKQFDNVEDIAMVYCTKNARMLQYTDLENIKNKYNLERVVVLSDVDMKLPEGFTLLRVPVKDLFEKFNTYIYTGITNETKIDCSPRFIPECLHYNKKIIYHSERFDKGMLVRKNDIEQGINIELKDNDEITSII